MGSDGPMIEADGVEGDNSGSEHSHSGSGGSDSGSGSEETSSELDDLEEDGSEGQAEEEEDSDAADPAAVPKTRIARRANGFCKRWFRAAAGFLGRYSKRKWARDTAARAGTGPSDTAAGPSEEAEGAAGQRPQRQRGQGQDLVEAEVFACILMPSGKVKYTCSAGIKQHATARHQRDAFIGSLQLMVNEQRLTALNDQRAVRMAKRKMPSGSTATPAKRRKLAPSKQLRKAARAAFRVHVKGVLKGQRLKMCKHQDWGRCKVEAGASACSAGGQCQQARKALGYWPDELPLVDMDRVDLTGAIHKATLELLKRQGFRVEEPTTAAPQRLASVYPIPACLRMQCILCARVRLHRL